MTLRYNANLVADGAKKDGDGNTISNTYAKSANLATVATSGDYTDLSNTPTIPAAQVQADWNQSDSTAVDYIKNKPTIPSISGLEETSNKVTSLSSSSTDAEYPSAKCVYDIIGDIETLLQAV